MPPSAPEHVTMRAGSDGASTSIDILWKEPGSLGGSRVLEYRVDVCEPASNDQEWKPLAEVGQRELY